MKEIKLYRVISNSSWFGEPGYIEDKTQEITDARGEDISLRINSPGGSVFDGYALISHLAEHDKKITAKVEGEASSMAGVILGFADHVEATEFSQIMIHKAYSYSENESAKKLISTINNQLAKIFKAKGLNSELADEIFLSDGNKDYWFTAKEAKKAGIVNKVIPQKIRTAAESNLIDDYYSMFGNVENKIIYNNNNEVDMGLFDDKEKKALEKQISDLTENVTNLTNANTDLNEAKTGLEEDKTKMENEINKLNGAKKEDEVKAGKNSLDITAKFEALEKENTELKNSVESNTNIVVGLGEKHDALLAQIKKTVTGFEVEDPQNGGEGKNKPENYGRSARIRNKIEENK